MSEETKTLVNHGDRLSKESTRKAKCFGKLKRVDVELLHKTPQPALVHIENKAENGRENEINDKSLSCRPTNDSLATTKSLLLFLDFSFSL